jgi:hypothetical protein
VLVIVEIPVDVFLESAGGKGGANVNAGETGSTFGNGDESRKVLS